MQVSSSVSFSAFFLAVLSPSNNVLISLTVFLQDAASLKDDSISASIKKAVTEESKRLDKIAELETQLAELKAQEKEDATINYSSDTSNVTKYYNPMRLLNLIKKHSKEIVKDENDHIDFNPWIDSLFDKLFSN